MKNEGWNDISEGWGGFGCSEGFGGLHISTDTLIEGWHVNQEGWPDVDSGTQI